MYKWETIINRGEYVPPLPLVYKCSPLFYVLVHYSLVFSTISSSHPSSQPLITIWRVRETTRTPLFKGTTSNFQNALIYGDDVSDHSILYKIRYPDTS